SLTTPTGPKDYSDGLTCEVLDRMLAEQSWLCPILLRSGNRASYSPTLDRIVCPEKRQFPEGAAFWGTLLHEVTHSTGHPERLNRPFGACYGDADYIREELVAELTAALCGAMLGFATTPREESAAYIKDWLAEFHKEPTYLFDILTDVNRAARMISERLACEQEPETPGAIPAEAA
ncbi:zincin-like metallopeptidase domain-containing protein, partial [Alistipes putredinis]|uniref:zincin-like metallopeptidase domain-containing protein n=1 Tax=Alistipes putredinis TaxID=28117 RepID=UPI003AAF7ADD